MAMGYSSGITSGVDCAPEPRPLPTLGTMITQSHNAMTRLMEMDNRLRGLASILGMARIENIQQQELSQQKESLVATPSWNELSRVIDRIHTRIDKMEGSLVEIEQVLRQ